MTRAEIEAAMRTEAGKQYALTATGNGARLLAAVILALAHAYRQRHPNGHPLLIGHQEYFDAYLAVTGLTPAEAPLFVRIAHDHREDQLVEYRRDRVLRVGVTPEPQIAVAVCGGWPAPGPERYSFEDRSSSPHVRSIHERVNGYYLAAVDGMVVLDGIHGIGGRATSGFLGFIFRVLGDADAVTSRMAFADDGAHVALVTARKGITKTQLVTVTADGRGAAGTPRDRPDLATLAKRLERRLSLRYVPHECDPGRSLTPRPSL